MKQIQEKFPFAIKGMNQDNDVNSCDGSYSFENYNIRIDSNNHTYALVNEKGNKKATIKDKYKIVKDYIKCTILDSIVINDFIVLFVYNNDIELQDGGDDENIPKSEGVIILKVSNSDDSDYNTVSNIKYNFGINEKSNIAILATSENSDLYKVYFSVYNEGVGKRFIIHWNNIGEINNSIISAEDFNILNYIDIQNKQFNISIENGIHGYLPTGTMQYFIRLSDKYGYATDFFWQSPVMYTVGNTTPNTNINCSYSITVQMLNDDLDVEVYVAYASSNVNTPQIFNISKSAVHDDNFKYTFIDNINNREFVSDQFIIAAIHNDYYYKASCNLKSVFFIGNVVTNTFKKPKEFLNGTLPTITDSTKVYPLRSGIDTVYTEGKCLNSIYEPNLSRLFNNRYFHNREHYRLGLQAMFSNGNWSSVVFLGDHTVDKSVSIIPSIFSGYRVEVPIINWNNNQWNNYKNSLRDEGFIAVRPVVVYPNIYQRKVLTQGVCNPTVYRYTDRMNKEIWSQASWIWRPMRVGGNNAGRHINNLNSIVYLYTNLATNSSGQTTNLQAFPEINGVYDNVNSDIYKSPECTAEYRHLHVLPNSTYLNSEIINNDKQYYTNGGTDFSEESKDLYGVDTSIFTFHSPDIEYSESISDEILSSSKFRIIGYVPITSKYSNIDLTFDTAPQHIENAQIHDNFLHGYSLKNINAESGTVDSTCMYWCDHIYKTTENNYIDSITDQGLSETDVNVNDVTFKIPNSNDKVVSLGVPGYDNVLYPLYIFHKSGSYTNIPSSNNLKYSTIKYSTKAYYHYSEYPIFLENNKIWKADETFTYTNHTNGIASNTKEGLGIYPPKVFNSTALEYINIGDNYQYCGNIDTLASASYNLAIGQMDDGWDISGLSTDVINIYQQNPSYSYRKLKKYFNKYTYIKDTNIANSSAIFKAEHSETTSIKYKTTKHVVIRLKNDTDCSWGLPLPNYNNGAAYDYTMYQNYEAELTGPLSFFFKPYKQFSLKWDTNIQDIVQPVLQISEQFTPSLNNSPSNHILWLGELYRDSATFGEPTEDLLSDQQWVIAGPTYVLSDKENVDTNVTGVEWLEGDTYYSRYDCLKTYPYTENDMNQIVDILSFRCESRVNTDGYYDNNRTPERSLYARPQNHGLLNTAYSKIFDVNNAVYLSDNSKELTNFPSSVFWSEQKLNGENTDTWYNMTLANQLDVDGKYGKIIALESLENYVYAFQENAISRIYYDTREAVTTESGLSLTIANNKKVTGYDIVCYNVGVQHYKSITNTGSLIYFVDSLRKIFYVFDGKNLVNISLKCGMKSWFSKHIEQDNDFYVFYEYLNNEVYIENTKYCIVYNENSASFTSFYPYYNIKHLHNINNKIITYKSGWNRDDVEENKLYPWSRIYKHFDGNYNIFYDKYEPYYIDLFCAPRKINMQDSVFTSLEYVNEVYNRDGIYMPDITYSHISVGVPYYDTMEDLEELHYSKYGSTFTRPYLLSNGQYSNYVNDDITKGSLKDSYNKKPYTYKSNLQKKFGIWRAELPRPKMAIDSNPVFRQNRLSSRLSTNYVRYPWVRIKLYNKPGDTRKSILHNLNVVYYN